MSDNCFVSKFLRGKAKMANLHIVLFIGVLLLASCQSKATLEQISVVAPDTDVTEPPPTITSTQSSTQTPIPTLTSTPTVTPSPTPAYVPGMTFQAIGTENAEQVELLISLNLDSGIYGTTWAPDGSQLGVSTETELLFYSANDLLTVAHRLDRAAPDFEFHPDGTHIMTRGSRLDAVTGERQLTLGLPYDYVGVGMCLIQGMGLSSDGRLVATTESGCTAVRIWDTVTGENLWTLDTTELGITGGAGTYIYDVDFNPEGTAVVFGNSSGPATVYLYLWYFETGEIFTFELPSEEIRDPWTHEVEFSPDGRLIASAEGWGRYVRLWDVATQTQIYSWEACSDRCWTVSFSPDGTLLATGGMGGPVYLWDVSTGEQLAFLGEPDVFVWDIAFNPEGILLVTGEYTGRLRIWGIPQP